MLSACAPAVQRAGIPTEWRASPNFDARRPNLIVVHYTGAPSPERALATLTSPAREVSAHYLIERDGRIWQLVDERARAWHAGDSRWGPFTDVNSSSIGIELDNDALAPFPAAQIDALLRLLGDLVERLRIPRENVVGHADVAPRRKRDPGPRFPWRTLARAGFGLWCDPPYPPAPPGFDPVQGMRLIGYDVADPHAAMAAFRAHFVPDATPVELAAQWVDLIHCLAERRRGAAHDG